MTKQVVDNRQRRLVGVATATAVVLWAVLVAYSAVSYWHLRQIEASQQRVRRASAALAATSELFSAMQDAETGQRGYLLTGDPLYLAPYDNALEIIGTARKQLRFAIHNEAEQSALLDKLDPQIDAKLAELAETLRLAQQGGVDAARTIITDHRGLREMDAIRATIEAIEKVETSRRNTLRDAADVSIRYAIASLAVSTAFSCVIVAIGFYVVQREMAARRRLAEFLQSADRNENEFLAMLGHELRNPLAAICNAVDVLDLLGTLPEPVEEMQDIIRRQTRVMGRLVDDLLDTSRIAHGKIELCKTQLDLTQLVERVVADMRTAVQGAEVTIEIDAPGEPVWVRGDGTRLAQVIGNLLHNAVKFSRRGGRVLVKLAVVNASKQVRLSVTDQGIGMDRRTLEQIFEPFAQGVSNGNRSRGGLGLGLSLAKGLVELHGGEIAVHSDGPAMGTTFVITLPLDERPAAVAEGIAAPQESPAHGTIVIIDDRRDSSYPLQRMLELGGHEVRIAVDGMSGLKLVGEVNPDLVLCDIGLPGGISGYDVARMLRATSGTSSLCLVALTAYGDEEARRKAFDAGFDRYLTKPASLADIRAIMESIGHRVSTMSRARPGV